MPDGIQLNEETAVIIVPRSTYREVARVASLLAADGKFAKLGDAVGFLTGFYLDSLKAEE